MASKQLQGTTHCDATRNYFEENGIPLDELVMWWKASDAVIDEFDPFPSPPLVFRVLHLIPPFCIAGLFHCLMSRSMNRQVRDAYRGTTYCLTRTQFINIVDAETRRK